MVAASGTVAWLGPAFLAKAARRLATDPGARAAVRSGYSNGPVMANFRAYGLDGVLQKPFDTNELVELVKSTIRG